MQSALVYRSFAKINLYLEVVKRRRDGYHNIETLFQTVDLFDELRFTEHPSLITLACSAPELANTESNLIYRAAMLLRETTGCTRGARIVLDKKIPIAAGLAGGSGNAAATLVALNALWDLRLDSGKLLELALRLGSDVPYCMKGGTVAATGRGEQMRELPPLNKTWFVLLHPPLAVSASRVYTDPLLEYADEKPFAGYTRSFRKAMHALQAGNLANVIFNRMERPVFAAHPHLADTLDRLLKAGCCAAAMSGSGPTLFGVCASRRNAQQIAEQFPDYPISIAQSVPNGVERVE